MKQVFQDARTAEITVADVPAPKLLAGCVLMHTAASLVSAGTERASSEFASKNLLQKARMRPDLVREVLNKINRDGLLATVSSVRARLDQPSSLGYSSAGTVVAVGEGITDINPGDRIACAGAGHAVHAEFACVPRLLLAKIPSSEVTFDEAAFTTLGSVALHGVRTADVKLGDVVAVIGLGLLGQLAVQILKAAGCRVLAMDISSDRADLALRLGADEASTTSDAFQDSCLRQSAGRGVDSVIIAAQSASNDPVNLAGAVARDRAIVVAVGTVAMDIPRRTFYEKELDFRVSRSYGPGRYDSAYERKGVDYPIGYVRWTETRNMEAFLALLADRKLNLQPLITHRFSVARAQAAYEMISGKTQENFLGVLITYPETNSALLTSRLDLARSDLAKDDFAKTDLPKNDRPENSLARNPRPTPVGNQVNLGVIGAGSFATSVLLPALKKIPAITPVAICAASGAHARHAATKFGFASCVTDDSEVFDDPSIDTVLIATRHNLHAAQVVAALNSGKHVFCEKPLCLNETELGEIVAAHSSTATPQLLMVGFNRRFAPMSVRLKNFMRQAGEPLILNYRVNAGLLPRDHWLNDPSEGGGRILGEVCHFVDLLSFLTDSHAIEVETRSLPSSGRYSNDNLVCSLRFADGSLATITYTANGDRSYSKERIEIFGGGKVAVLEDFRQLEMIGGGKKKTIRSRLRQDKGHLGEWQTFAAAIQNGGVSPIAVHEIVGTMMTTFALEQSRCLGQPASVSSLSANNHAIDFTGDRAS